MADDSIAVEGDHFVLAYSTVGYTPKIDGNDPQSPHIHFFYDNIPASQAGVPGLTVGLTAALYVPFLVRQQSRYLLSGGRDASRPKTALSSEGVGD